ncbi:two-component system, OmpR family, phosphate regulon sensor histidine kinase PhoR [Thermosyntropha lipolytica DSM 11003]|uniref:histidine kinase n=1 Tax=Thermosyntropha lipolytica DSM 11003 TaxID=1123382 RepID=A0A1M5K5Z7_9FIRM|nr:ATP-binding protein [Thermosyntropha lipolytica]SHG48257.1 two-component system, OmpR family, phosphate regulon sensor histidine kinase PhoR [Thermosyntropha lipolytica DSM 11003]
MFSSVRSRLTITYLIIIAAIILISSLILSYFLKEYYLNDVKNSLVYEAVLVSDMLGLYKPQDGGLAQFADQVVRQVAQDMKVRVTVIDGEGKVLADSHFEADSMESHAGRPEVYKALKGQVGKEIRFSTTAGINMLYVAVPFKAGEEKGVIRLSKPLTEVENLYKRLFSVLFFSIIFTGLAAFIISIFIARNFSRPISDITEAVRDIARGNLKRRVHYRSADELGMLAGAVDDMADHLENTIMAISEVKNRFEAVLNNTVNAIIMLDAEKRLIYANPVAERIFNLHDEYMGRKSAEVVANYELLRAIDEAKARLVPVRRDINLYEREERIIEANVIPVMEKERGFLNSILIVMNDITELKRLERIRRDFVANVSHELKTPVAAISGFAETLMEEKGDNPENIREFSRIIYNEAQRLKNLIDELLELSRIEAGKMPTNMVEVDVDKLAQEAADIIKMRFPERQDDIAVKGEKGLVIKADREQLMRIMLNLLENAVHYSPPGSRIGVEVMREGEKVLLKVSDEGEGIPENEIPRVFERFYRVDKARSRKTGGTGLGLAIVKHLVENHKGEIRVESKPGKGSVFTVVLPVKPE